MVPSLVPGLVHRTFPHFREKEFAPKVVVTLIFDLPHDLRSSSVDQQENLSSQVPVVNRICKSFYSK